MKLKFNQMALLKGHNEELIHENKILQDQNNQLKKQLIFISHVKNN